MSSELPQWPGWKSDGSYIDAYGDHCMNPETCRECGGSGVSYGETCLSCGGMGRRCPTAS